MAYIYTSPEKANIYIHDFDSSKQVIINDNAYFFSDLLITEYEVDGKMSHIVSVGSEIIIDTSLDDCFFIDGDKVTEGDFIDYLDVNGSVINCCQTTYDLWKEIHGGTLEEFFAYIKGEEGKEGEEGGDGKTPEFREHLGLLQWRYIGDEDWVDLYKFVDGEDGKDGVSPHIGLNGNWYIGQLDTGIKARGEDGKDGEDGSNGHTPVVGINGNWWINGIDTGLPSRGEKGESLSYDDLTIEQIEEITGGDGDYYEWRTHDGFFQIKLSQDEDTEWKNIYPLPKDAVLPDIFFPDLQARCLATKTEWAKMPDGEKLQIVIDKLCSVSELKRTGARNYIKESLYDIKEVKYQCPVGYTYDENTGLCRATGSIGVDDELDLILIIDNSGSVNSTERTLVQNFTKELIQSQAYRIENGHTRVAFVNYNASVLNTVNSTFDFSDNYQDIYDRTDYWIPGGGATSSQIAVVVAKHLLETQSRPNSKKQILVITDGRNNNSTAYAPSTYENTGYGIDEHYALFSTNQYYFTQATNQSMVALSSHLVSDLIKKEFDASVGVVVLGTVTERNQTKTFYSQTGQAEAPFPSEGDGILGLQMWESEFTEIEDIVSEVTSAIDVSNSVPPTIYGGDVLPESYALGSDVQYVGSDWDGLMQGNVSQYMIKGESIEEGNLLFMNLEENIEVNQDYGYSQFIKTSKKIKELSVWLVGAEQHLLGRIQNPEAEKWYRIEGVRNLTETIDVAKETCRVVIRYKKEIGQDGHFISIYRPVLTHGETIPDWMPSLYELTSDIKMEQEIIHSDLSNYALLNLSNVNIPEWQEALGIITPGVYLGAYKEDDPYPTTRPDGLPVEIGDWIMLIDLGGYVWDGTEYVYDFSLTNWVELYEVFIPKLANTHTEASFLLKADGTRVDPQTLIEEKEIVAYDSSNPRPAIGEEGKLYVDTDTDKGYLWDETTQDYVGIGVIDLSNYYNKTEVNNLLSQKVGKTGDESISDKKTFTQAPASNQDATAGNDLIRKSQWDAYNVSATNTITQALNGKEDKSNKKTNIESNKDSNTFYAPIKAIYDWAVGKFLDTDMDNLNAGLSEIKTKAILDKLGVTFSRIINVFGETWTSLNEKVTASFKDVGIAFKIKHTSSTDPANTTDLEIKSGGVIMTDRTRNLTSVVNTRTLDQFYGMGLGTNDLNELVNAEPWSGEIKIQSPVFSSRLALIRYQATNFPIFKDGSDNVLIPEVMINQFVPDEECLIMLIPIIYEPNKLKVKVWVWCDEYVDDLRAKLDLLVPPPTYISPTAAISLTNRTYEVGTTMSESMNVSFNQNDAGDSVDFKVWKNGIEVSQTNSYTETGILEKETIIYQGEVSYEAGEIKNNIFDEPDDRGAITAGSVTSPNRTIRGEFRIFFGFGDKVENMRTLPQNAFESANNLILNTGTTEREFYVAVPDYMTLNSVVDLDALNAEIGSQYIETTGQVADASGTLQNYKIYTMTIDSAYSTNHRHRLTFN